MWGSILFFFFLIFDRKQGKFISIPRCTRLWTLIVQTLILSVTAKIWKAKMLDINFPKINNNNKNLHGINKNKLWNLRNWSSYKSWKKYVIQHSTRSIILTYYSHDGIHLPRKRQLESIEAKIKDMCYRSIWEYWDIKVIFWLL